jgi:hypothetical protein
MLKVEVVANPLIWILDLRDLRLRFVQPNVQMSLEILYWFYSN